MREQSWALVEKHLETAGRAIRDAMGALPSPLDVEAHMMLDRLSGVVMVEARRAWRAGLKADG